MAAPPRSLCSALLLLLSYYCLTSQAALPTVPKVDWNAYAGRWYQVYANAIVVNTFERNGYCMVADYSIILGGKQIGGSMRPAVTVRNTMNKGSQTGALSTINGYAYVVSDAQPAQLIVNLDYAPQGTYWIVKLGPLVNGQYQYSVVTDNKSSSLFVLTRDPKVFATSYQQEVLDFLKASGFDRSSAPVPTPHSDKCKYAPLPTPSTSTIPTSATLETIATQTIPGAIATATKAATVSGNRMPPQLSSLASRAKVSGNKSPSNRKRARRFRKRV